jgi:D-alanine-D-alanine ligase
MSNMQKILGLFCGGFSSEYEISLKSAATIKQHFPKSHKVYRILVEKKSWQVEIENTLVDFDLNTGSFLENGERVHLDLALVYTHGDPGENGKIQAYLDMKEIPYLNSNVLASTLSFDKWYCNQFLKNFEIPVAKSVRLIKGESFNFQEIAKDLGFPMFVKPTDSGSSYGISKVKNLEEIEPAIAVAFKEGRTVVIESFLKGREITCGVYKTKMGIQALPLTEIVTENEFFDFSAKYEGKSREITPAPIEQEHASKIQGLAVKIYELLQLSSIARIDFMLVGDVPHVIEVNTTPGFSPASIVPQMIAASGKTITEFWQEILESNSSD